MGTWQLQEAKAKLSEVIETAEQSGPQVVTRRGIKTAVIVSFDEWQRTQPAYTNAPATRTSGKLTKEERAKSEAFLKLLRSAPDFEIPDRHRERVEKRRAKQHVSA